MRTFRACRNHRDLRKIRKRMFDNLKSQMQMKAFQYSNAKNRFDVIFCSAVRKASEAFLLSAHEGFYAEDESFGS